MSEAVPASPAPADPAANPAPAAPEANPAVAWCRQAYAEAYKASKNRGSSESQAKCDGGEGYCKAMPPLCGAENIRNFIACVAYAMVAGIYLGPDANRLLYAVQVAQTATERPAPGKPGRPKSQPPPEK